MLTQRARAQPVVESLRDWGRDCWCDTGCDNTCGKRFSSSTATLPLGYDHKYVYSRGRLQPEGDRPSGGRSARSSWAASTSSSRAEPTQPRSAASGPRRARRTCSSCPRRRRALAQSGSASRSACARTRRFAHEPAPSPRGARDRDSPAVRRQPAAPARVSGRRAPRVGPLAVTNAVTERAFWIGCYPGLTDAHIDYAIHTLHEALAPRPVRRRGGVRSSAPDARYTAARTPARAARPERGSSCRSARRPRRRRRRRSDSRPASAGARRNRHPRAAFRCETATRRHRTGGRTQGPSSPAASRRYVR